MMKEGEEMRSFLKLIRKKAVLSMLTVFVFAASGILLKADVQTRSVVQAQTAKELTNVTASVDNVYPSQNTTVNVTVTGPARARVSLVCHYESGDIRYSGVIRTDGKAVIPVQVESASPGYAVFVDVLVTSDKTYTAQTMFIPQ
jgi:hypothetical protein